jgi:hypothetical protein
MARNRVGRATSPRVANAASKVLRANTNKSLSGSVLSQSDRMASHSTKSLAERILTRHDKAFSELSKK